MTTFVRDVCACNNRSDNHVVRYQINEQNTFNRKMSVKEVFTLRRVGKLKAAFNLARRELYEQPSRWTRMSMFWVIRDLAMQRYLPVQNEERLHLCLCVMEILLPDMIDDNGAGERACRDLCLLIHPNANEIRLALKRSETKPNEAYQMMTNLFGRDAKLLHNELHEDFGWILYRYMKANTDQFTSVQIRRLLKDYIQLRNRRPSLLHSVILKYALNFSKEHYDFNFYSFFLLWGAENLSLEDYLKKKLVNGCEMPTLLHRICCTILKSNAVFNASDFISKFEYPELVVDTLRQAFWEKLVCLHKEDKTESLFQAFDEYATNYSALGPSRWHSEILKTACRFMVDVYQIKFISFFIKWGGLENLRREDWKKETDAEGKELPSLAETASTKCFEMVRMLPSNTLSYATLTWLREMYKKVKMK